MSEITDDFMQTMLGKSRQYSMVLLRRGPGYGTPESLPIIREHGRRNFELRAAGVMAMVGPLTDGGDFVGMAVLPRTAEETAATMDGDPAVQAGIFTYEIHTWRTFPGDGLPLSAD